MIMKHHALIPLVVVLALSPFFTSVLIQAQPAVQVSETSDLPQAVVLAVKGKCEYSEDGSTFTELKVNHVFNQGAVVRTAEGARTDIFFRRIGTTVRLQAGTEVKLEKMTRHTLW